MVTVASGNTLDEWNAVWDENADFGQRSHLVVRGTGNAVISVMSGAALASNLPEIGKRLSEWTKRIVNSRGGIRKVLATSAGRDHLKKYFDKFVNDGNFEDWFEKAKNFKLSKDLNFEVHHAIPVNVLENNTELQRLLHKYDFDLNGMDNAIPLQKKSKIYDINGHGNHPQYDDFIKREVDKILTDNNLDDVSKFQNIQGLIEKTRNRCFVRQ